MQPKILILTLAGFVLLGLGAVGLLLPVWPTTPFVIAATACFSGTPKLRARVMKLPLFGAHANNYQKRTGLSVGTVVSSLVVLWGMLILSCFLAQALWLRALLFCVGAGVTVHILWMARPKEKTP